VTNYDTDPKNSVGEALADLKTYIETIDSGKTIYACAIMPLLTDREKCVGYIIHEQ